MGHERIFKCKNNKCETKFYESALKIFEKYNAPCYCGCEEFELDTSNIEDGEVIVTADEANSYFN